MLWSLPSLLRACIWAAISRARRPAARRRSVTLAPVAPPAACTHRAVRTSPATALANSPPSVGYATVAAITVVSARTLAARSNFCPAALAHNASFSPATTCGPHRLASFISVVGCGTGPSSPIRQNRRQLVVNEIETSDPPRHPAARRHVRGPGRKALAAVVLSGAALVIFGDSTRGRCW